MNSIKAGARGFSTQIPLSPKRQETEISTFISPGFPAHFPTRNNQEFFFQYSRSSKAGEKMSPWLYFPKKKGYPEVTLRLQTFRYTAFKDSYIRPISAENFLRLTPRRWELSFFPRNCYRTSRTLKSDILTYGFPHGNLADVSARGKVTFHTEGWVLDAPCQYFLLFPQFFPTFFPF